jgi:hypothetical protein
MESHINEGCQLSSLVFPISLRNALCATAWNTFDQNIFSFVIENSFSSVVLQIN